MSMRWCAAVVSGLAVVGLTACAGSDGGATGTTAASTVTAVVLAPQDGAAYLAATPGVTVIDVRTPAEFATGHLEHAVNMDIEGGGFSADIKDLPKDGEYAVYCHSGRRSAIAVATMVAAGFTRVHDLGGIVDWQAAGLPVVTG